MVAKIKEGRHSLMSVELNFKNHLYQFTANTQLEKVPYGDHTQSSFLHEFRVVMKKLFLLKTKSLWMQRRHFRV